MGVDPTIMTGPTRVSSLPQNETTNENTSLIYTQLQSPPVSKQSHPVSAAAGAQLEQLPRNPVPHAASVPCSIPAR